MSRRSGWLRRIVVWLGPILTMMMLIIAGFFYWVLASTPGSRWAVVTAASFTGNEVHGVSGSLWHGLTIERLFIALNGTEVELEGLHLEAEWLALLEKTVHIEDLSARRLALRLESSTETSPPSEPFQMPGIPVTIRVDRLALGEASVVQDDTLLPVLVENLESAALLAGEYGQVSISRLDVSNEGVRAYLDATLELFSPERPWPFQAALSAEIRANEEDARVCARHYLATLPGEASDEDCILELDFNASGSLEEMALNLNAHGQGLNLDAYAALAPDAPFWVEKARMDLALADGSGLQAQAAWKAAPEDSNEAGAPETDVLQGQLSAKDLDLGELLAPLLPPALLRSDLSFELALRDQQVVFAQAALEVAEGSRWNDAPLSGQITLDVGSDEDRLASAPFDWTLLRIDALDIDVQLGKNHVQAKGDLGWEQAHLALSVQAPALANFWPTVTGGVSLDAELSGGVEEHTAALDLHYTPQDSRPDRLGQAPAHVRLELAGSWHDEVWQAQLSTLEVEHAVLGVSTQGSLPVRYAPHAHTPESLLEVGAGRLNVDLEGRRVLELQHERSRYGPTQRWASAGRIERLQVSQPLIHDVQKLLDLLSEDEDNSSGQERGGVKVKGEPRVQDLAIDLALNWDLQFEDALAGRIQVQRLDGDILVPADPPVPLGLEALSADIQIQAAGNGASTVLAQLDVRTAKMGQLTAKANTRLQATAAGSIALAPQARTTVDVQADIEDLAWLSLFSGDAMDFGGQLHADVQLASQPDGTWSSTGTVDGENIRVVRIDEGIRLLDGTLRARLEGDRVLLDELVFPARLRAEPKEWRTAEWISTNPEAQDGFLKISGEWRLGETAGGVDVELYRYPILQRADRYAMVSGQLKVDAPLPGLSIEGSITADAGWFDLDMLGGIPTVDGDVVVIRAGEEPPEEADVPMDISMAIDVDLGPRFYLTGYGVNSGLVGSLQITMVGNKLTALGALRTRGGAIEAYGQRLQLRRGTITFQGDITSPILDIEALRTGLAVEAGVRVAGTAKRPRIDLVSYPEVQEIEKLSWLLFGHGPDESGGDLALLLTVGTSFLGDGEPFYRKFGIDEISLQSGEIGSAGSILPAESVVSGLNSGANELERKFVSVSKGISRGFTISVRQALSDAGTVGLISYRLARGLTAELVVGTINGLALVYRWFSRD